MPEHSFFKTILFTALLTTGTALAAAPVPPDTTPSTQCSGNSLLEADGSCIDTSNVGSDNQGLPSVLSNDNSASQDLRINTDGQALELNSDNSGRDAIRFLESGNPKWDLSYTNEGLRFRDRNNNVETLRMTSGNNVQIPNGNLDLRGSSGGSGSRVDNVRFLQGPSGQDLGLDSTIVSGDLALRDSSNTEALYVDSSANVNIPNGNLNMNGNQLDNVGDIEMDGNIHGSGVDMSLQEVGSIIGPRNGDTDLNI